MKKIYICFVLLCSIILFAGCKSDFEKASENLSSYNIEIVFDDSTHELFCKERVTYVNNTNTALSFVMFHLYPNAFRQDAKASVVSLSSIEKAYPNGKSYGEIKINSCKAKNNESENFEITGEDENILKVDLGKELYPNESTQIEIEFGVILPNINHRFGYGENAINLANFYPIACVYENGQFNQSLYNANGDPFFSDMANYEVIIECSSKFEIASTGKTEFQKEADGKLKKQIKANCVRDFALVLSDKFEVKSANTKDCEVFYYYYDDEKSDENLKVAIDALLTFEKLFGDYPYSTLSVVKTNFVHGGMEYPNLVYISDEVTEHASYIEVIVHEIAHQWWYNIVGNNAFNNSWLDEGLTEFSTALFFEHNKQYNIKYEDIITNSRANWNTFEKIFSSAYTDFVPSMNRSLNEYRNEYEYTFCTYVRGLLMFDDLRQKVGEKKVIKSLKLYFEENKYQISHTENLISAFCKGANCDLEGYYDSWINGKTITNLSK